MDTHTILSNQNFEASQSETNYIDQSIYSEKKLSYHLTIDRFGREIESYPRFVLPNENPH